MNWARSIKLYEPDLFRGYIIGHPFDPTAPKSIRKKRFI